MCFAYTVKTVNILMKKCMCLVYCNGIAIMISALCDIGHVAKKKGISKLALPHLEYFIRIHAIIRTKAEVTVLLLLVIIWF